ncbi:hypothetical protein BH09BAC2_BH09BAC2_21660 [soil metagenome]
MKLIKTISIFCCLCITKFAGAQDLHFSQFYNAPLLTNPANTGFIPDADYRLGAHYRNQYSSILSTPYKTMSVFGDAQVFRNKIETGWLGLGGVILRDEAGSGGLTSTKVYGSVAYHQMLGYSSLLSAGFNVGWANKRIDQTKLKFPDQFDGKFFDATLPTSVVFIANNISYLDIQAGMNYAYFPTEKMFFNAGYSIHHVNSPRESFFSDDQNNKIPIRHIAFVNGIFKVAQNVIINPNIYFTTQAKARQLELGINGAYNLSEDGDKQLIAGLYYRVGDAIIPTVGFQLKNIKFTFSYDATMSSLRNFNNMRGASEFNVLKKGFYSEGGKGILCPTF